VLQNFLESTKSVSIEKKLTDKKAAEIYCATEPVDMVICNIDTIDEATINTITSHNEDCLIVCAGDWDAIETKGFEEHIFSYLYKPFSYERIMALVTRVNTYKGRAKLANNTAKRSFVFIKSEYKTIRVDLESILYCEGLKDYTQIYLKGRSKPLVTLQNLKSLLEKLPANEFVRVHRSFIVSIDKMDAISRNEITIGTSEIPIGDAYREKLFEMIGENS